MNDTISRAAAKQAVHDTIVSASTVARVWDIIDKIPAVDAGPVVRCRDCKHCFSCENDPMTPYDGETDWYCAEFDVDWHVLTLDPNRFYCANGERREDE